MDRRFALTAVAAAVSAGTLACGDKTETTAPDFGRGGPAASGYVCSFSTMKNDVDLYFATTDRAAVQTLVSSMKLEYGSKGSATATSLGFDILAKIADAHRGTPAGTPVDGSRLANDVLGCMTIALPTVRIEFAAPYVNSANETKYAGALSSVGAFEVRGGTNDLNTPIRSANLKSAIAAPVGGFDTWLAGGASRLLFYAQPVGNGFIVADTKVGEVGYRWLTVPERHTFTGFATAGVCVGTSGTDRLQEVNGTSGKVLGLTSFADLGLTCAAGPAVLGAASGGIFGNMVQLAKTLFLPSEAYAAYGGGTGGLLGGLSDLGVIDVGAVQMTMDSVIDSRTRSNSTFDITVYVKTAAGSALPGETVTLAVTGNSGSFNLTPSLPSAVTDENGMAFFGGLHLDKPGGYTITAADNYGATTPATVASNLFHIKQ